MKTTILILLVFCAVVAQAQQYYKTTKCDETATSLTIRVESTITPLSVERVFQKKDQPVEGKKKNLIKKLINELRVKDSLHLSAPLKPRKLPNYYEK